MTERNLIRYKLLSSMGTSPWRAHSTDAGFDLFSAEECILERDDIKAVGTDVTLSIPRGYMGLILSRSSKALDGLWVGGGVIDATYSSEIKVGHY